MIKFIKKILNILIKKNLSVESNINQDYINKIVELDNLIIRLRNAYNDSSIGGVFHSIKYYDTLDEVSNYIKNNEFGTEKPEYYHYNSIIDWYTKIKIAKSF